MTCRDRLHPSTGRPPAHIREISRNDTMQYELCWISLLRTHRDFYESRSSIPCMFYHYNCMSSQLENNTWNINWKPKCDFCEKGKLSGTLLYRFRQHEVRMLTTNLITTATAVYQHSTAAAARCLMWFGKTLLCPSQVVTCAQVTVGIPHLASLEYRNRNNQGPKVGDTYIFL